MNINDPEHPIHKVDWKLLQAFLKEWDRKRKETEDDLRRWRGIQYGRKT